MKNFLSALFIISIGLLLTACNIEKQPKSLMEKAIKNNKIIVGVSSDSKPFGYKNENGELVGYDIDLARILTKKILGESAETEFVEVTPQNRIITLTSGKADMIIATMSVTPQRKAVVNFTRPYHIAGQALMTSKTSDIQGLTDLKDKRVIVVLGTTGERSIKRFVPNAIIRGYRTNTDAYNALKNKEGDAMITDDSILTGFAMEDSSVKILSKRYTQEPYAVAFRTEEESHSLHDSVDHMLEHLSLSGELNKLKNKWLRY